MQIYPFILIYANNINAALANIRPTMQRKRRHGCGRTRAQTRASADKWPPHAIATEGGRNSNLYLRVFRLSPTGAARYDFALWAFGKHTTNFVAQREPDAPAQLPKHKHSKQGYTHLIRTLWHKGSHYFETCKRRVKRKARSDLRAFPCARLPPARSFVD